LFLPVLIVTKGGAFWLEHPPLANFFKFYPKTSFYELTLAHDSAACIAMHGGLVS
jgi:hypothetical protein